MSPEKVQMSAKDMKEKKGFIKIDDDKFVDQNGKEFNIGKDAKVYNNDGIPQFKDVKKGIVWKGFDMFKGIGAKVENSLDPTSIFKEVFSEPIDKATDTNKNKTDKPVKNNIPNHDELLDNSNNKESIPKNDSNLNQSSKDILKNEINDKKTSLDTQLKEGKITSASYAENTLS